MAKNVPPRNTTKKKPAAKPAPTPSVAHAGEQVEIKTTAPTPPDKPRYPAGLRIKLTRQEIDDLGLPADTYEVLGG